MSAEIGNLNVIQPFDRPDAVVLAKAKKTFLNKFLPELIKKEGLKIALDAGCGFGYFSGYLKDLGFEVTAFDGRPENITEASKRNPEIKFMIHDVGDYSINKLGLYDVVLCLGVLYHLENPFRVIRNFASITKKVLVIETMVAPYRSPIAVLREEGLGQDQALNYVALIPSESCLLKMLYKGGFPLVYKCSSLPDHEDFRSSILYKRRRAFLIAAKIELQHPMLHLAQEPKRSNRYIWYRLGLSSIVENELLRKNLKSMLKFVHLIKRGL